MKMNIPCKVLKIVKRYAISMEESFKKNNPKDQVRPSRHSNAKAPSTQDLYIAIEHNMTTSSLMLLYWQHCYNESSNIISALGEHVSGQTNCKSQDMTHLIHFSTHLKESFERNKTNKQTLVHEQEKLPILYMKKNQNPLINWIHSYHSTTQT